MSIELTSFYPHGENGPMIDLKGSSVHIKVGFVPRANLAALSGERGNGFAGEMGSVLLGVAIDVGGTIVEQKEIPIDTGRTGESNMVDWDARLQAAITLFQEE